MDEKTLDELERLGHVVGLAEMAADGRVLINVDGKKMTYREVDDLLDNERGR